MLKFANKMWIIVNNVPYIQGQKNIFAIQLPQGKKIGNALAQQMFSIAQQSFTWSKFIIYF